MTLATIEIPALTVHQPWASLIAAGAVLDFAKGTENRGWPAPAKYIGGLLAIHAGKAFADDALELPHVRRVLDALGWPAVALPAGKVLAVVDLADCHPDAFCCRPWGQEGQWHWTVRNVRPLAEPFPARGKQKIWRLTIPASQLPEGVATQ